MAASRDVESIVLSTIDKLSEKTDIILIESLYRRLREDHNIDRISAGKLIVKLCKKGKLYSPRYYCLKKTEKETGKESDV